MQNWMLWAGLAFLLYWYLSPKLPAEARLSPGQVRDALAGGPVQLIDVRTGPEYRDGHIQGAKLIPLQELAARSQELDRSRPAILVCRSGQRSGRAYKVLKDLGFTQLSHLEGGMSAWGAAGLGVER